MTTAERLATLLGSVPLALRRLPNWVLWKHSGKDGRKVRLPIDAKNRRLAKSNDSSTWATFGEAIQEYLTGRFDGISFAFAKGAGMFGIDLDSCISDDGEIAPWAEKIVADFGTYAEVSPSGTGIKLWGYGDHNETGITYQVGDPVEGRKQAAIELYGHGRFFAVTGQLWSESPEIRSCRVPLALLVSRIRREAPRVAPILMVERSTPMIERARRWVAKIEPAVSGQHGHSKTFRVACRLIGRFHLSMDDAYALLTEYSQRCEPPWSVRELEHKIRQAWKKEGSAANG